MYQRERVMCERETDEYSGQNQVCCVLSLVLRVQTLFYRLTFSESQEGNMEIWITITGSCWIIRGDEIRSGKVRLCQAQSSWSWRSDQREDQRWHPAVTLHRAERKHLGAAGVLGFYRGHSDSQTCYLPLTVAVCSYCMCTEVGQHSRLQYLV